MSKVRALAPLLLLFFAACNCGGETPPPRPQEFDGGVILRPGADVTIVVPTEDGGVIIREDAGLPPGQVGITSISPAEGPTVGLTPRVTLQGFGFVPFETDDEGNPTQRVFFGDTLGIAPIFSGGNINVFPPPGLPGPVDVRVENDLGVGVLENGFTYFSPIEIEAITPAIGPAAGGTSVTLTGSGFSADMDVLIGERQAVNITFVDENTATLITPPGNPGRVDVRGSDPFGNDILSLAFTYEGSLTIDSVEPSVAAPASFIEVLGSGFQEDATVFVGGVQQSDVNFIHQGRLRLAIPAGAPLGLVSVRVSQSTDVTLADALFILGPEAGALAIDAVTPTSGSTAGGYELNLAGSAFSAVQSVSVGGTDAVFTTESSRHIRLNAPAGTAGPAPIVVVTDAGTATFNGFSYVDGLAVTAVDPSVGDAAGGTAITITGSDFIAGMNVLLGGIAATDIVVVDANTITATTPAGSPGSVDVVVDTASLRNAYRYEAELNALSITPTRGGMSGGTFVTISGTGFTRPGAVAVTFNNTAATDITVLSDSLITAKTPPNAPGVVDINVTVGADSDAIERAYTYFDPSNLIGGTRGGPIQGAVYVTVFDAFTALPVEGLAVFLGVDGTTEHIGLTNVFGQATLSGPDVFGAQSVSVVGDGYEYGSLIDVNASEITLYLQPLGGIPQPPPPPQNTPCGDGIIQFPQECDDGMQCDSGQACEEYTCQFGNQDCPDSYQCVLDQAVGEQRCKPVQCADGSDCFEYECRVDDDCEENYECVSGGQNQPSLCHAMVCNDGVTACNARRCQPPAEGQDDPCGIGFACVDQAGENRCKPVITGQFECGSEGTCGASPASDCAEGSCEQFDSCDDGSLCLTRYTDGCTGSPSHGALHCAPDDLLCNQMRQCRPGCEVEITVRGRVFGFAKEFFDPALLGEDEIAVALVVTTSRDEFSGTPNPCQFNVVFQEGGEYFIARSRTGPLALVALAGIFNLTTGELRLRQMGVRRPAFPAPFTHLENQDIELTIPLDKEVALSFPDAPVGEPGGPTITRASPFLRFGSDGSLVYTTALSTDRNHLLKTMPDVPGELLTFVGGAFTTNNQGLITEQGTANSIDREPFVTGIGTNWDATDAFGNSLVEGAVIVITHQSGAKFAGTIVSAIDATTLLLDSRAPFTGAAMTYHIGRPGFPQSEVKQDATGDITVGGITMNPVLGLPEPTNPVENGAIEGREIRWRAAPGQQPTAHLMILFEPFNQEIFWTFYLDGSRTKVPVPRIPDAVAAMVEVPPRDMPVGPMVWQHQAMYIPGFIYNNWSYLDLGLRARRSWTTDVHFFVNGVDPQ